MLYKAVIILYLFCFSCYVLFTRVPDYFYGEFVQGVVSKAAFSEKDQHPLVVVDYKVGKETLQYKTGMWFLSSYKPGEKVTIIYNPAEPSMASIYAVIGYWIIWPELLFTASFFTVLFLVAKSITGTNSNEPLTEGELRKKRKYDQ